MYETMMSNPVLVWTLFVTCVVAQATPGPNNFIVLSATLSDTRMAALKTFLAVVLGFPPMVLIMSLAVVYFGDSITTHLNVVKYLGIAFLLYFAVRLFLAPPTDRVERSGTAPGFLFMVLFQWTNPKALAMASSTAVIAGPELFFLPALIFLVMGFPCVGAWFLFGDLLKRRILGTPYERYLNCGLAVLLALSVLMMI